MASSESLNNANRSLLKRAVIAASVMFFFGFSMVPIYDVLCEITGLNGKTGQISSAEAHAADLSTRTVRLQFVTTVNSALQWQFTPEIPEMTVRLGELSEAWFDAKNLATSAIVGQAVPSVAPGEASIFFNKTECFCFTEQKLEASEKRRMLVRFVIDPNLPESVDVVTLSYTFFNNPTATAKLASR
jgi:cytochrome c oxidase assembly protein subunit 11